MRDIITKLMLKIQSEAFESSKIYNNGEKDYAYSFGYAMGTLSGLLEDLNLSDWQIKVLQEKMK